MTERYEVSEKKPMLALFFGVAAAENLPVNLFLLELVDKDLIDFSLIGTKLSTVSIILTWLSVGLAVAAIILSTGAIKQKVGEKTLCIWGLVLAITGIVCDLTVMPVFILLASCSESCTV